MNDIIIDNGYSDFYNKYKLLGVSERVLRDKVNDTVIKCPVLKIERTYQITRSFFEWILRKPIKYNTIVFSVIKYTDWWRNIETYTKANNQYIYDEFYIRYQLSKSLEDNV